MKVLDEFSAEGMKEKQKTRGGVILILSNDSLTLSPTDIIPSTLMTSHQRETTGKTISPIQS